MLIHEKTAIVTGCSSGFGRVAALELAKRGWQVFATVRKEADQESLLAEATTMGCANELHPIICDITQPEQVAELAQRVAETTPRLDALLNNAGTAFAAPLELLPLDDLRAQFEVNVVAQLAVIQAMLPLLKPAKGTIINVSSISGRLSTPITGAYSASKFALEALSDALRLELAPFGVRVVLIEPGSSPTTIWQTGMQRAQKLLEEQRDGPYARPLRRVEQMGKRSSTTGFPPHLFATTVIKILSSKHPRARYAIPRSSALVIALRRFLPERVWDALLRLLFG
ncbi:MAG TPA: SDR family NAD(P)-dependent oxidoreductase [Ktedonobacteraceae bacterium]|nr:SDR family NAD(P)-dependent oxidoreductase [Ktedonobacteraceae bacterium]